MSFRSNEWGGWVYSHEEHEAHERMVAEVERLRAELFEARQCRQREHDLRAQFAGEIEGLHADKAKLKADWDLDSAALRKAVLEMTRLQAENAELRDRTRQMLREGAVMLRDFAGLDWFRRREQEMQKAPTLQVPAPWVEWLLNNPIALPRFLGQRQ